jgi:hypothetical protein
MNADTYSLFPAPFTLDLGGGAGRMEMMMAGLFVVSAGNDRPGIRVPRIHMMKMEHSHVVFSRITEYLGSSACAACKVPAPHKKKCWEEESAKRNALSPSRSRRYFAVLLVANLLSNPTSTIHIIYPLLARFTETQKKP